MDNFMKNMFGPVKGGLCRLAMDGNIAIKTNNGYKTYDPATKALTNCDNFVFDVGEEMFFVMPTNKVEVGDIILIGGGADTRPCYVFEVAENKLKVLNYKNGTIETVVPERHMFMGNTYFYGKIVSLFGNFADAAGGNIADNVIKYMMLSQMMKGSDDCDGFNPMMMMMMSNGGFGNMFDGMFGAKPEKN